MISSIVVSGEYNIGVNANGKFQMGDIEMSVKDVPFVRYRFHEATEATVDYILGMMKKFNYSAHLLECRGIPEEMIAYIQEKIPSLIIYYYMEVSDDVVESTEFPETELDMLLEATSTVSIQRIMLDDRSNTLDAISLGRLKALISNVTGFQKEDIGVCGSPLSFGDNCCLTAVKARELASIYCKNNDFPLPTAKHQSMNCCGCIRYYVYNSDCEAPMVKKGGKGKMEALFVDISGQESFLGMNLPDTAASSAETKNNKKRASKKKYGSNISKLTF